MYNCVTCTIYLRVSSNLFVGILVDGYSSFHKLWLTMFKRKMHNPRSSPIWSHSSPKFAITRFVPPVLPLESKSISWVSPKLLGRNSHFRERFDSANSKERREKNPLEVQNEFNKKSRSVGCFSEIAFDHGNSALSQRRDRKSTRLNSSHSGESRMPSSA